MLFDMVPPWPKRNLTVARATRTLQPAHSCTKVAHVLTSTLSEGRHARGMVHPTGQTARPGAEPSWRGTTGCLGAGAERTAVVHRARTAAAIRFRRGAGRIYQAAPSSADARLAGGTHFSAQIRQKCVAHSERAPIILAAWTIAMPTSSST
jgi:hypothetical protein